NSLRSRTRPAPLRPQSRSRHPLRPSLARLSNAAFPPRPAFRLGLTPLLARRLEHHALELQAVGIKKEDRVIALAVLGIAGRRIDHLHVVLSKMSVEGVHVPPAAQLERIMVEADIADPMRAALALRVGFTDPEQRLAVAPTGGLARGIFALEPEKAQHR